MFSAGRISLRLTGCSWRGGGSVNCFDWTARLTDSLIDAAPVTGSLLDSALSDCLIELCTAGFSSTWTFCRLSFTCWICG